MPKSIQIKELLFMFNGKLRLKLLNLFYEANALFLKKNKMNIEHNTSERNLCALLGESMSRLLLKYGLSDYFVDVEYNRNGYELKRTINEDEIFCDLILHSRGTLARDNLIALEMKKSSATQHAIEEDRTRLKDLTSRYNDSGYFWHNGNYFPREVCGYKLGILYIVDVNNSMIRIELFSNGRSFYKDSNTIESFISYPIEDKAPSNWFNFYPVGHGLFYSGILNPIDFSFVFDCGTMKSGVNINQYVDHLAKYCPNDYLDFLAISHLHLDHISGVPYLMKKLPPKKIFLPYISGNFVVRVGIAASIMSFTAGIQTITPILDIYEENREMEWERIESDDDDKTMRITFKNNYWQFVFLTKSISAKLEAEFFEKLEELFEKTDIRDVKELVIKGHIKELQDVYRSVFGASKLNETSLVMLHYPLLPYSQTCVLSPYVGTSGTTLKYVAPVSLLTGDAILDRQMASIIHSFVKNDTGIIQVPHHGSYPNWDALNTNLLRNCAIYLVPKREKDLPKSYLKTLKELQYYDYYVVTEKGGYMYWINIY